MKSKGFTLIELMVVVALIALLTSVVAALIGDGRDKAAVRAFRQEVDQLVKAIELYRADNNGRLPPTTTTGVAEFAINQAGSIEDNAFDLTVLTNSSNPYIQEIPKPPFAGEMRFATNLSTSRCEGDPAAPEYLVWVSGPKNIEYFADWPSLQSSGGVNNDYKCFSIR